MQNLIEAPLALAAGVLTILSPCVLPMLPILLGTTARGSSRARPLFVLGGFVSAFSALGMLLAFATSAANFTHETLRTAAIAALLVCGLMRIWPRPYEWLITRIGQPFQRITSSAAPAAPTNVGGFLLGLSLGAVWTPCAGPVLASILALVAQAQDLGWAAFLLVLYAIGAAVPMLAVAYAGQLATGRLRYFVLHGQYLQQLFGALLVLTALAIYFQYDVLFSSWLLSSTQPKVP